MLRFLVALTAGILPPPTPLRQLILPPLLLSLLSPVLASLTSATSSDSIWPLAGLMFFVHVLLADFSTGTDQRRRRREKQLRKEKERRGSAGSVSRDLVLEEKRCVLDPTSVHPGQGLGDIELDSG
jgi:phosphatidylinositol glycan class C protein